MDSEEFLLNRIKQKSPRNMLAGGDFTNYLFQPIPL